MWFDCRGLGAVSPPNEGAALCQVELIGADVAFTTFLLTRGAELTRWNNDGTLLGAS